MTNSARLVTNATVSVAQTIISGLVLFLLYRYLIDQLGAEQLGLWSVVLASTAITRLSDMGLTGSVVKYVARYHALNDEESISSVIQTAALSIALVMGGVILLIYPLLDNVLALAVPEASMDMAKQILPFAVLSLWIGSISSVFQSGLDGCQRMDIRNYLLIVGNILFLGSAYILVPLYGLVGIAIGQVIQGLFLLVICWLTLKHLLKALPKLPIYWSRAKFKEMFSYALNFQINSIAILFIDPIIKFYMSRFGGLSSAAYYEMASQVITRLRGLLLAANQALVPAVAVLHETTPEKVRELYLKVYRMLFFLAIPLFAAILITLPIISMLWIGREESQFIEFGSLLAVCWGINILASTSFFINLGTGDLRWNTIALVTMAIMNTILGFYFGSLFGGLGVVVSFVFSLILSSLLLFYSIHRSYLIPWRSIFPPEHNLLVLVAVICTFIYFALCISNIMNLYTFQYAAISFGLLIISTGVVMWFHPYKKSLMDRKRVKP